LTLFPVCAKQVEQLEQLYHDLANVAEKYGVFGKMSIYHEVRRVSSAYSIGSSGVAMGRKPYLPVFVLLT